MNKGPEVGKHKMEAKEIHLEHWDGKFYTLNSLHKC